MKNLLLTLIVIVCSLSVFAAEPTSRPEFVNQLVSSNANQNAAAFAWGTTDNGTVWFICLAEAGYIKFFLDSPVPVSTLRSSKKFDVYFRGNQTIVIGDTVVSLASREKVIQDYLKKLEKLGLPALTVQEILKG